MARQLLKNGIGSIRAHGGRPWGAQAKGTFMHLLQGPLGLLCG